MMRNKYPEQTVARILDAAAQLFLRKGYEKTTLQDIISATGLSKGAVYHHFASKEAILEQVCERISQENAVRLCAIRDDPALSGRQKLQAIYVSALTHQNQTAMMEMVPYQVMNPRFLAENLKSQYEYVAPCIVAPILRQGREDGSIPAAADLQAQAEAIMALTEVWLHPLTRPTAPEEMRARCRVFNQMTAWLGFPLLTEPLCEVLAQWAARLQEQRGQPNPPAAAKPGQDAPARPGGNP